MIHPKALMNIQNKFKEALNSCVIDHRWPVYDSYADKIYEAAGEVIKHKKDWLTESSVFSIFRDHVYSAIDKNYPDLKDVSGTLNELLGTERTINIADALLKYIESIPRKYLIYFPIPGLKEYGRDSIELTDGISIRWSKTPAEKLPQGLTYGVVEVYYSRTKPKGSYICIEQLGYAAGNEEDSAIRGALSKFKQLIYLGSLGKLFVKGQRTPVGLGLLGGREFFPDLNTIIFDQDNLDTTCCSIALPRDIAIYIDKVRLNTHSNSYKEAESKGNEAILTLVRDVLSRSAKLVVTPSENKYALPVKSAIEWAFDASINDNETLSFVQTCIGLEAILGDDSDKENLTEALSDRCAYLIGTNIEKRRKIKERFKELYRLRSKLVHGRAVRLQHHEKIYLELGKHMLNMCIQKEIENLNIN